MFVRRLCERPGCSEPVSASYGIDNAQLVVWLDSSPSPDPMLAGSLCRRHADALIVPKGWRIDDRREEIPRLFPAHATTSTGEGNMLSAERERHSAGDSRRRSPRSDEPLPSLFDESVTTDVPQVDESENSDPSPVVHETVHDDAPVESETDDDGLEETRAIPWMPRIVSRGADAEDGASDDDTPSDATPAQGRLLRRAFGDRNVR